MATANQSLSQAAQRAQDALSSSPVYALRELRVAEEGGQLRLEGEVLSFYHKQLAQEAVRAVAQNAQLQNAIAVTLPPPR